MPDLLVIDDDIVDRKTILRALRDVDAQFDIVQATNGAEAIAAVSRRTFDCIFLDFRLPDVDGLELLDKLLALGGEESPPIIMLTGEGNEMVAVQAMKKGAADYIPKASLSKVELIRALENALEKSRMRRDLATARQQMERMALYDTLTGLGNRNLFSDYAHKVIATAARNGGSAGVMLLDLDKFKQINDGYGHEAGDAVLKAVGARLVALGREADSFFRLGGDEFAAVVATGTAADGAETLARKIIQALSEPIAFEGHSFQVGVSIGIAMHPAHGNDPDELLRLADAAMYAAKRGGLGYTVATRGIR